MSEKGTIQKIAGEFAQILLPIKQRVEAGEILLLLAELGLEFPNSVASNTSFTNAVNDVVTNAEDIPGLVKDIIDAITVEDYGEAVTKTFELTEKIIAIVDGIEDIKNALSSINFNLTSPTIPSGVIASYLADFGKKLLDFLLITYAESYSEEAVAFLELFGIVERKDENVGSTNPLSPEYTRKVLHLQRVAEFLKSPGQLLKTLYNWGPTFNNTDADKLLKMLNKLMQGMGWPSVYTATPAPKLDLFLGKLEPNLAVSPPGLKYTLAQTVSPSTSYVITNGLYELRFEVGATLAANAVLTIQPNGKLTVTGGGSFTGDATVGFTYGGGPQPLTLIDTPGASRFEIDAIEAEAGVSFATGGGGVTGDFHVEAALKGGKIVIKPANPDGFLAKILPEEGFTIDLELLMGYSSEKGFYFDGSGGFEIKLPLHLNIGPLSIDALTLSLKASSAGIPIALGADVGVKLGPFAASVENMGIKANFTFPPGNTGNLGFANVDIDFKPPTGVGLSIDAGVVKGGGFLSFDYDKGRYTGIVQLSIKEMVNVTAIGLITTKNPDGSKGFSMLLMITAEFTPIQLGFGFTLNGVGGLVGVNRTMVLQALRDGVRTNALDNILFPSDPIANATQIISDMETVFPQQQGRYVFGLMAIIGWGTPTLISVELGLMLEVPNPIRLAILGVVKMVIPTEEAAILKLQVNFVGTIDFEAKYITFDASLYDSKLLIFTLEGDMALRIKWGSNSNFLFTVGGFHPDYTPPPLNLPALKRLSISLLSGNPRLTITSYFAVTSNTLQFGAGVDFYFSVKVAKVTGYLYFDALFQFNPFYFKISLNAGLSVYIFGAEVMTIQLQGILEGPTPWHITGRVKIKILFVINVNVSVETTWGESKNTSLPNIDVLPKLREAIQNKSNWITGAETNSVAGDNLVRIKTITNTADNIIAHPNQSLSLSQKVVPLDVEIARFGTQKPADFTHYHLDFKDAADVDIPDTPLKEEFAPVSFFDINGSDKLKRPNFEKYNSGLTGTGTNELKANYFRERDVKFEEIVYDRLRTPSLTLRPLSMNAAQSAKMFNAFVRNGSAARSVMGQQNKNMSVLSPGKVSAAAPQYAVVNSGDLSVFEGIQANSLAEAQYQLDTVLRGRPELEGTIDIMPAFQLA